MTDLNSSQALKLWQAVVSDMVLDDQPDLTIRQMAILLAIYLDPPPHTVRGLAARFDVTKPVITRALNTMGGMGLVTRRRDERDRRNVIISRTVDGTLLLEQYADLIMKNHDAVTTGST